MNLELDHFFILVEPEAKIADELVSLGMIESFGRTHKGQGTSNRRFQFSNGMLEFLWVHDAKEAAEGPARDMLLCQRAKYPQASPFGVILHRKDNTDLMMPFDGWQYQPDYFQAPHAFHIGSNANDILEPLCIYAPFMEPSVRTEEKGVFKSIRTVCIYTPIQVMSDALMVTDTSDRLSIINDEQHLMEIVFDDHGCGQSKDLRPEIPLIIYW